jgi:hypothetical protein
MFFINNQGVAAGYIATESSRGPLPARDLFRRRPFQPSASNRTNTVISVTGIDDQGVVVGNPNYSDFNKPPYIARNGVAEYPTLPGEFPLLDGISNAGTIYGSTIYPDTGAVGVFTIRDGVVNRSAHQRAGFL